MKLLHSSLAATVIAALSIPAAHAQETATTDPVGFVTVGISAGTGSSKRPTLFSVPLLETEAISGQVAGTITGVTSSTISNSNAGWTPGQLSDPAKPYVIVITSGAAAGRMFLIASSANTGGAILGSPNTADTVTVSSADTAQVNLTNLGINVGTDTYKILACDTISSFFGVAVPGGAGGVLGGASAGAADTIVVTVNGSASTYFYNTSVTPNRWSKVQLGAPDSSNVALLPYYGLQYNRLANTQLSFVTTGGVPTIARQVGVKNSGVTLLSQFWPSDSTLLGLGLQTLPGWTSGPTAAVADTVVLSSGGSASTYFYNGTNWLKVQLGFPISDTTPIPVGTAVLINKKGTTSGFSTLSQAVPYSLN